MELADDAVLDGGTRRPEEEFTELFTSSPTARGWRPRRWTCRACRRGGPWDRDPAHPAVSDVVADLQAEDVAIDSQGCVRIVVRRKVH
jgi:hypothetical protein